MPFILTCLRANRAWFVQFISVRSALLTLSSYVGSAPGIMLLLSMISPPMASGEVILDLQADKTMQLATFGDATLELININPKVNLWHLLRYRASKSANPTTLHLELTEPGKTEIGLKENSVTGITLKARDEANAAAKTCTLWESSPQELLDKVKGSERSFISLCAGAAYLRMPVTGARSTKESVVEFLRDNVWGGEKITTIVKETIYKDQYLATGVPVTSANSPETKARLDAPESAQVLESARQALLKTPDLGLSLKDNASGEMHPGLWYESRLHPHVFVSVLSVEHLTPNILETHKKRLGKLDQTESKALGYFVAFDLAKLDLRFALGTEHPRVDWSDRARSQFREKTNGGPDGLADIKPFVGSGMVRPDHARRVLASFAGGFKRSHSAFKWGPLALKNQSSHYGFLEGGTILSKLQPDLATIALNVNGEVSIMTWRDQTPQTSLVFARQNGVPLVEWDENMQRAVPGLFVSQWAQGNWSGSAEGKQRTVRAGACLQESAKGRFLIYGYFSSVTPAAMAASFLGFDCRGAIHLDMNALEHTYMALYERQQTAIHSEHLIKGMEVLDRKINGVSVPRFVGFADNRDFFYLTEKQP